MQQVIEKEDTLSFRVLLVDDSDTDATITLRAFKKSDYDISIKHVNNGEEALDYLTQNGNYVDPKTSPRPDLILLDIRMPKMDGFGFLDKTKKDDKLKTIPIVMLTSSAHVEDVQKSYSMGAAGYLTKASDFSEFVSTINSLIIYWGKNNHFYKND